MSRERRTWNSVAVVNPIGIRFNASRRQQQSTSPVPSAMIMSAFVSEIPFMATIRRFDLLSVNVNYCARTHEQRFRRCGNPL